MNRGSGSVLSIVAMHRSQAAREDLREEQENRMRQTVTHIFPKPPAGHPWHAAKAEAVRLGQIFQEIARVTPNGDPKKKDAFGTLYAADKIADGIWAEWKAEYQGKLTAVREYMGEQAWPAFWNALPDGDAMAPIIDAKLEEMRQAAQ